MMGSWCAGWGDGGRESVLGKSLTLLEAGVCTEAGGGSPGASEGAEPKLEMCLEVSTLWGQGATLA